MNGEFVKARFLARAAKQVLLSGFRADPNIVGAAFGRRIVQGERLEEPAVVVYVMRKVPKPFIPPSSLLPRRMYVGGDAIEVDVLETGPIYALSFTAKERPAPSGISVGHIAITSGTLGCLVKDLTDGTVCILSNNHVLANGNLGVVGDVIVQSGPADGGSTPADDIATLKRFVMLAGAGNTVDCAIGQVLTEVGANVVDQMKNNLMPVPSPGHPAVGLLFAGSCNRTFMNPINDVLSQLNVQFLAGAGSTVGADVGMNVEKVGRTTEYTSSTITEIDVTATVGGYPFGSASFDRQIATAWLSDGGDSGSIVCRGGDGGNEDHCGCGSSSSAAVILGTDVGIDAAIEKEFRERYLSQTRVGRYLLDLFFRNEERILDRVREASASESDRAFARYLYDKHGDEARQALLQPSRSDIRLTDEHLRDAREALGRAMQYMKDDERQAAEELFKIAYHARERTPREILAMLDDEGLLNGVRQILSGVRSLEQPELRKPSGQGEPYKGA